LQIGLAPPRPILVFHVERLGGHAGVAQRAQPGKRSRARIRRIEEDSPFRRRLVDRRRKEIVQSRDQPVVQIGGAVGAGREVEVEGREELQEKMSLTRSNTLRSCSSSA
jgi:hypothetical protein